MRSDNLITTEDAGTGSIFTYQKNALLKVRIYDPDHIASADEIKLWIDQRVLTITELLIIKALYKYAFLNRRNMEKVIGLSLKPALQKPKYTKNIEMLYEYSIIAKYEYTTTVAGLTFYTLLPGAYEYMKTFYRREQKTHRTISNPYHVTDTYPMPQILERLSLNQAHINLLCEYKNQIKRETYYGRMRFFLSKLYFPSVIQIKTGHCKVTTVFSIACPKEKSGTEIFARRLLSLTTLLDTNGEKDVLLIIVCESIRQIEKSYAAVRAVYEFSSLYPVYTIDLHTAHAKGLEWLYEFRMSKEGSLSLETYDLHLNTQST